MMMIENKEILLLKTDDIHVINMCVTARVAITETIYAR